MPEPSPPLPAWFFVVVLGSGALLTLFVWWVNTPEGAAWWNALQ